MFEQEFEDLLIQYREAISVRSRFSGLMKDFFPGQQKQINLMMSAYDLGISGEIEKTGQLNNAFAYRFVKQLMDDYGVSRVNADWAVSVWCVCYGQKILHKPCDIRVSSGKPGAAPVIQEEKANNGQYGDLFSYTRSGLSGNAYAVVGFNGSKRQIIFQNSYRNCPVLEIQDKAFQENPIEEVILTEGYRRIGNYAFSACGSLKQVVLPQSLKEIGDYAFAGCSSLGSLTLPLLLEQLGSYALSGTGIKTLDIPNSVFWIGDGTFAECKYLKSMVIKDNINEIPKDTFKGCVSLEKVKLHERISSVGERAFSGCINLQDIYIPDSVTSIGEDAFAGLSKKFILLCGSGSCAEEYARKHNLSYQLV